MRSITQNLPKCEDCAIRRSSLFGELETEHLDKARQLRSHQIVIPAGEHLYHEGDEPDKAFTLFSGWVSLFKNLEDGNRQILRFALPGDFLCYKIGRNRALDHSAIALSEVTLCAFPIERFRTVISELPELSFAISAMTEQVTERCHTMLTSIASHTAEAKVAYLLLSLYIRETILNKVEDECVHFPITQEDIGDALGLTSIHVNRVFQSLRKQGLIDCKSKCLKVHDTEKLAKVAKVSLPELQKLLCK